MTKKYAFTRSLFETLITKTAKTIDWLNNQRSNWFLLTIVYEWHTKDKRPERSNVNSMNPALVLRGHVTKASFKHWVGILLMPKIDRAYKNYLTPEIWEETHLREIFYGTLIFQQSSMICICRHVGGHTLALQHGGQNYSLFRSC